MEDGMYIWKQMSLEELEENLYALQIDYNPPLTEAQRETVLQKLEAFINHVKSITLEQLEEQTKAKWKAYRKELDTCCQDPVFAASQENNLLFSNSQIVFLKDTLEGKTVYHCILRGEELDYAIQEKKIPSIQKELTVEQLNYLIDQRDNNPYPRIEVTNIADEVKERIFNQVQQYVPPVYKEMLTRIEEDSEFMGYSHGSLYKFAIDLTPEDYNLFLTDVSLNRQLDIIPDKTRAEYARDVLQFLYSDYSTQGGQRIYQIMTMIVEFVSMLQEKWNYAQLFIKKGYNHYNEGKELLWNPVEIKYPTQFGTRVISHTTVSRLGPKFNIVFDGDKYLVSFYSIDNTLIKSTSYDSSDKKTYSHTYPTAEVRISKSYYEEGEVSKKKIFVNLSTVRTERYSKNKELYLTIDYIGTKRYTYYPVMGQLPLTIMKSKSGGLIVTNIHRRLLEDGQERSRLVEQRIFDTNKGKYSLKYYDLAGNPIPFVHSVISGNVVARVRNQNTYEDKIYTDRGQLRSVEEFSLDNTLLKEITYNTRAELIIKVRTYLKRLISGIESIDLKRGTITKSSYIYDYHINGGLKTVTFYIRDGVKRYVRNFNENQDVISAEYYTKEGVKFRIEYFSNKTIYKQENFYPSGAIQSIEYYGTEIKIESYRINGSKESVKYYRLDKTLRRMENYTSDNILASITDHNLEEEIEREEEFNADGTRKSITYFEEDGTQICEFYSNNDTVDRIVTRFPDDNLKEQILRSNGSTFSITWRNSDGMLESLEYFREDETLEKSIYYYGTEIVEKYYGLDGEDDLIRIEYYIIEQDMTRLTKVEYYDPTTEVVQKVEMFNSSMSDEDYT